MEENEFMSKIDLAIRDIDLNIEKPKDLTFYYYKRWIWMIFPWACIQTDNRFPYSRLIKQCYTQGFGYISTGEDLTLSQCKIYKL